MKKLKSSMTPSLKPISLSSEVIILFLSAVVELVLLRLGLTFDFLLVALVVVAFIGSIEAVLLGGVLGYLILAGPFLQIELIYLLIVPIVSGYFAKRLLGVNLGTIIGLPVLGILLFYFLLDARTLLFFPSGIIWDMLISTLWVSGIYLYWGRVNYLDLRRYR
ncbi:MAG: hypothetical protein KGZ30_04430 [Anaplasmataceae bacterium]|nr:hypothetical protein [Anaplasmataceae bacterium]